MKGEVEKTAVVFAQRLNERLNLLPTMRRAAIVGQEDVLFELRQQTF